MLTRFRYRLKGIHRDLAWRLGMSNSFFNGARGARILVYHGLCQADHLRYNTLFLKLKNFENQLRLFKKYFQVISLDAYYQNDFDPRRFAICLSFDDGFANNFKYVLPLLEKYRVPASFFITGIREAGYDVLWNQVISIAYRHGPQKIIFKDEEFVKGQDNKYLSVASGLKLVDMLRNRDFTDKAEMIQSLKSFLQNADEDYWLQMKEDEIRQMAESNWVTIGSHGYFHNDLGKISVNAVKDELKNSKQYLEKLTGKPITAIAFPYGSYTRDVINIAKQEGYKQLLATEFLYNEDITDPTMRERLTINPFISDINQLHACITGHYR